jgi:chromate transport protein ChrA
VLWLLSYLAVAHSDVPAITGLLYGIQPVVIAIVVEAVLRIGKRTINHRVLVGFAVLAFVALYTSQRKDLKTWEYLILLWRRHYRARPPIGVKVGAYAP